ncbi:hypothetical protein A2U01_0078625, partial [Trifolium medium]|nr:hypothetical protein [Trifolium medium]
MQLYLSLVKTHSTKLDIGTWQDAELEVNDAEQKVEDTMRDIDKRWK